MPVKLVARYRVEYGYVPDERRRITAPPEDVAAAEWMEKH